VEKLWPFGVMWPFGVKLALRGDVGPVLGMYRGQRGGKGGHGCLVVDPGSRGYPCLLSLRTGCGLGNLGLSVQLQAKMGSGLTNYQDLLL
jgi:hypothetical protein